MLKKKSQVLYGFAFAIILLRIMFNWLVVEHRGVRFFIAESVGKAIVTQTKNRPLFIITGGAVGNFDGLSYYICTGRGEILRKTTTLQNDSYNITDKKHLAAKKYTTHLTFTNPYAPDSLQLVSFR